MEPEAERQLTAMAGRVAGAVNRGEIQPKPGVIADRTNERHPSWSDVQKVFPRGNNS